MGRAGGVGNYAGEGWEKVTGSVIFGGEIAIKWDTKPGAFPTYENIRRRAGFSWNYARRHGNGDKERGTIDGLVER
jgi:hypothetical protein